MMVKNNLFDLLIVGGSAAGVAAAIYAARRELKFKLVTQDFGGEVANSGSIGNYPGFNEINGVALASAFQKQLEFNQVDAESGITIGKIVKSGADFITSGKKGSESVEYRSRTLLLASGVHPRQLNVEGEEELRNKGVSYCTTCDGPLFRGKTVAVVGGGNSALESALLLKDICPQVYLLTINDQLLGENIYITKLKESKNIGVIFNAETKKFIGSERLEAIEYTDKKSATTKKVAIQGAFVHIGWIPNSALAPAAVKKNPAGEIITNRLGETSLPGLFAAGDVTDIPFKQIAIATGQGVTAVLQAIRYLDQSKA